MMNAADPALKAQYLAQMNGSRLDQNLRVMNNTLNSNGTPKSLAHETYFMNCFFATANDYVASNAKKYKLDTSCTTFNDNMKNITELSKGC